MALRQRNVVGTLVSGDGEPVANGKIRWKLKLPIGYTSTHLIVDRLFETTTESDGSFSQALWCDDDSLIAIDYQMTCAIVDGGNADPSHTADISLEYEDGSDKNIGAAIVEATAESEIVTEDSLAEVIDARIVANGSGGVRNAIAFDNTKHHNVYLGAFHKANIEYTTFLYGFVVRPFAGCEYIWSSGKGGSHLLLAGFNASDGAIRSRISGNCTKADGTTDVSFSSDDYLYIDQWHHFSVGYDGAFLTVYCHGVPSFRVAKTANRLGLDRAIDCTAYIGGSDHSNFNGHWAGIEVYENLHPFTADNTYGTVYQPRTHPRPAVYLSDTTFASPVLRIDPTGGTLLDQSKGFEGQPHPGMLNAGSDVFCSFLGDTTSDRVVANLPTWVNDPVALTNSSPLTAIALPALAKGGDNFIKADSTLFWTDTPGLGTSQTGGLLAAQTWGGGGNDGHFGVLGGRAYLSGNALGDSGVATLQGDSVTQKAEITVAGFNSGGPLLYINYTDANNYCRLGYGYIDAGTRQVAIVKRIAGVDTVVYETNLFASSSYASGYTLSLERTVGNHYIAKLNGNTWVDYDDSANTHLTGTKVGFSINTGVPNHFCRIDSFFHY